MIEQTNDDKNATFLSSYDSFSIETFKTEKKLLQDFRSDIEEKWKTVSETYLPDSLSSSLFSAEYTTDPNTGIATPDTYFSNASSDIYHFNEPIIAVKVHTALSLLTQRTPDVKWDSDNNQYDRLVPVINALRENDWHDVQTRQQYVMLWFYKILFGTTYWRRYYEYISREVNLPVKIDLRKDETVYEKKEVVEYDGTAGEALDPRYVWIDPSTQPLMPRSMRKVMWEKCFDYERFIDKFSEFIDEKKLREMVKPTSLSSTDSRVKQLDGPSREGVRLFYYENIDLDLFYVATSDNIEIIKDHLPQNHKCLSVLMSIWMPRGNGSPFGLGPIEMLLEDKRVLDELKSMTMTQTKYSIYKAIFYTGSLKSDGEEGGGIRLRPDRAYKVSEKPTFLEIPGPGRDSWEAIAQQRERVDDASGINRPLGGEIVKTTAFQTDLAKDAALARLSTPISNMVCLLQRDAELTFELQKQYYSLPKVEEITDPQLLTSAITKIEDAKATGRPLNMDLWIDDSLNEEGDLKRKFFLGKYRTAQLNVEQNTGGSYVPSMEKREIILTPELFDWRGKIYIISDSLLTITPTIDRVRKLEMFNLLIPMFGKPPEFVAKPAAEIVKLYNEDPIKILPEPFLQYLQLVPPPQARAASPLPPTSGSIPEMEPTGGNQAGALSFQQEAAPTVVTNLAGQKDLISARSEMNNV